MVKKSIKVKPYLTPNEVAEMLMVSPTTVRQWSKEGKIEATATPGGHRRFMRTEIERFARERDVILQLPDDQTFRILIVDDDDAILKFLIAVFKRVDAPIETMTATNGFDAGRLVQSFQPHLVLLDLMMSRMDGFEVCETIKSDPSSKATRVVAMTGFYDQDNVDRILDAGAESCLRKPFKKAELLSVIGLESASTAHSAGKH